jgi:hypothetical protein
VILCFRRRPSPNRNDTDRHAKGDQNIVGMRNNCPSSFFIVAVPIIEEQAFAYIHIFASCSGSVFGVVRQLTAILGRGFRKHHRAPVDTIQARADRVDSSSQDTKTTRS